MAARAGVSPTVVSRVLYDKAPGVRVGAATAERVRQAALDLGYRRNITASTFRHQQTMMIGVLHGMGFGRPRFNSGPRYFAALMDGIVDGAFDHGYTLSLCPQLLGLNPENAMFDGRFDGLIWYGTFPTGDNLRLLTTCPVPLVLIHTPAKALDGRYPSVICDNHQGIGLAVEHLADLGHKRIAFAIENDDFFYEAKMRLESFFQHMTRLGLDASQADVIDVRLDRSGIQRYLANGPQHTAVIGSNDGVGAAFIKHAPEFGLSIPEDLSVIGFDSTGFCLEVRPALTSVSQPLASMGRNAVNLLVQSIRGEAPEPFDLVIPCGLDIRGSTTFRDRKHYYET
ncbi:MAG: LacI family DNA-binding transcriptional regulator [Fimbriimonas sp.]